MKIILFYFLICFAVWAIPFAISIPFFSKEGQLTIPFFWFKFIMIVSFVSTVYFCLSRFYESFEINNFVLANLLGLGIILVSVLLDIFTIIIPTKMSLARYFWEIFVIYLLLIPINLLTYKSLE
jgi:hypothetical protein